MKVTTYSISQHRRVATIGEGYVSSFIAYVLTISNLDREIILIDVDHKKVEGRYDGR